MLCQNIPARLKQKVVDLLYYESRCNLRVSSKDDRDVVDSTKFVPEKLKISEKERDMSEAKPISILPNNLKVQKLAGHEDHNNFYGKLFGRLDGIRQPWEIELKSFPGPMSIYCKIWRRSEKPCRLYPFYFGEE
ncbi:hypothetical protein L5515_013441 [Caenorhabditis briggsae]|uniref:F-box domain-containing protein n=1 Tax=Caenorhabditis briggsae TaxID=6238 RepID=A0AAE9J655_CAEBR|nr:hypothetical protein L5515_013441 [Caenorhabditis briggsae]